LSSVVERNIQVELYRILQNVIRQKFSFNDIEFLDVKVTHVAVFKWIKKYVQIMKGCVESLVLNVSELGTQTK